MTRINCVPVQELSDPHLLAEYRELPRIFTKARWPNAGEKWQHSYTLGTGHMKFFYNKLGFLYKRQVELVEELKLRGFKPTFEPANLLVEHDDKPKNLWQDWTPTEEALAINRARIAERNANKKTRL
jgi:deoxyribonuclease (pyrimidine dimer)